MAGNKLYSATRKVLNDRTISPFIDPGGSSNYYYDKICIDTASTLGMCAKRTNLISNLDVIAKKR